MAVADMISAKQRAINKLRNRRYNIGVPYSDICLNTPYFLRFAAPHQWCGWVHHSEGASKVLKTQSCGQESNQQDRITFLGEVAHVLFNQCAFVVFMPVAIRSKERYRVKMLSVRVVP